MKTMSHLISVWFGLVMVVLVVSGSVVFASTDFMSDAIYGRKRVFFVILLLSYGVYRSFRIYLVLKQRRDDA